MFIFEVKFFKKTQNKRLLFSNLQKVTFNDKILQAMSFLKNRYYICP